MADFINTAGDAELLAESQMVYTMVSGTPAVYGLTAAQVNALNLANTNFQSELEQHVSAQATARAKTQSKEEKRSIVESTLRDLMRLIKSQTSLNASDVTALGQIATGGNYTPLSNPTRPAGNVDTSKRLQHTINFADEATPDQKRKPAGTVGCEIWAKVGGEAPSDEKECVFIALDTATPYVKEFDGADAGKMVHYMLRWSLKDGSRSSWSETVSATVTG